MVDLLAQPYISCTYACFKRAFLIFSKDNIGSHRYQGSRSKNGDDDQELAYPNALAFVSRQLFHLIHFILREVHRRGILSRIVSRARRIVLTGEFALVIRFHGVTIVVVTQKY